MGAGEVTCVAVVNCLGLWPLFHTLERWQVGVAGVEDVDVSDLVSAHGDYAAAVPAILRRVQLDDDFETVRPVRPAPY